MEKKVTAYPEFELTNIKANSPEELSGVSGDVIRVEMPSAPNNIKTMERMGYTFGDRTLGVEINLKRVSHDFSKLIRFDIQRSDDFEEIIRIAQSSFPYDRRFHVRPQINQETANMIIRDWVEHLNEIYVCIHRKRIVGFLDLEYYGDNDRFVHLAAVEERYRAAGVALSLYANAVKVSKETGCQKMYGRISSMNTAVMNLYTYLGATFSNPVDVFLKEDKYAT